MAIMALVSAIGCETIEQQSASGQVRALSDAEKREVQTLIYDAEDAFANNHLGFTHDGSALTLYRQVLRLDPENAQAQRGMERIIEHYIALALKAANRFDTATARTLLDRGRQIDPTHPSIAPAEQFIQTIDTSHREVVILRGLTDAKVRATINALVQGVQKTCRFRIFAANDARTRHLYQLLRASFLRNDLNRRPRASSKISTPERLERICQYENA
ncbi:MAG: hypothetical protein VX065_06345 [Pseudomonadota bacterium]|nr:hypothetical protein [Pseudomonadota bacterium]